jgi:hypothetical protein
MRRLSKKNRVMEQEQEPERQWETPPKSIYLGGASWSCATYSKQTEQRRSWISNQVSSLLNFNHVKCHRHFVNVSSG